MGGKTTPWRERAYFALLSLILPGAGQLAAGRIGWGALWLVLLPVAWVTVGIYGACLVVATASFQMLYFGQPRR